MTSTDTHSPDTHSSETQWSAYLAAGERRARALPNRGPVRYTPEGRVHPDILDAYDEFGFYVFEDVVGPAELAELRAEVEDLLERAPYPSRDSPTDRLGRPAAASNLPKNPWLMAPPLSDPVGGTRLNNGRHPVKMAEPQARPDAPAAVPYLMFGCLALLDSFVRVYAHPDLLAVAEAVNGADFTPFNEALFIKQAGLGPSVAWHQDGQNHWASPDLDGRSHGFNFQVQIYGSTAANGVWVVPGSHLHGKVDIKAMVEANGGSDRLAQAVPLVCNPGDAFITNRQALHGSFPNVSADPRVTVNFGFHRYRSVINQPGTLTSNGQIYDADYVHQRCRAIAVAIDARAQRYPGERRFVYQPFADAAALEANRFNEHTRREVLAEAYLHDLAI